MIRRHPVLSAVAGLYLVGVLLVTMRPVPTITVMARGIHDAMGVLPLVVLEFAGNVLLFVPVGLLFVVIIGRRRWLLVLLYGAVVACWVQLAEAVWLPTVRSAGMILFAHVVGAGLGTFSGVWILVVSRRRLARSSTRALTPVSQAHTP